MNKRISLLILLSIACTSLVAQTASGVHRLGNYNIRYVNASNGDTGERLWANRRTYVMRQITKYDFDVVGMEEVTGNNKDATTGKSQLQDLRDGLTGYADYSVERENKNYSYNSIFYKTDKYTLLDQGHFYVNEHPDTPGEGWSTSIARTCIWVHLEDKASGQDFYFVCTHVNYGANLCGIESAKLIGERVRRLVGQTPMVLVGDLNLSRAQHYEAYRGYASHFYDLSLTAPINICWPSDGPQITATTTGWTPATPSSTGNEFDYIWYDHMEPLERHIITDYYPEYGRTVNPSDHYPVLGLFRLGSAQHPTRYYVSNLSSATLDATATLEAALTQATMEDTIFVEAGVYQLSRSLRPSCSLTISGGWNSDFTVQTGISTLQASGLTEPVINIPLYYNLALEHVEIAGGNSTALGGGGAIYTYGPKLVLSHCVFTGNSTGSTGGAISMKGDTLLVNDCVFVGNTAQTGGALWCQMRDALVLRRTLFDDNSATGAGGAVELTAFNTLNVQQCAFIDNSATMRGALDISPISTPFGAYIVNCSFLGNRVDAKKGLASVTKRYGGAGLWADMTDVSVPLGIAHCTFMGNHLTFNGTSANFVGTALTLQRGKVCLMNNLVIANELTIEGSSAVWADVYTDPTDVNLWRDTYTLRSSSTDIAGWESDITLCFGGTLSGGVYTPQSKSDGTYPVYQNTLAGYNIRCLPTTQRLCESAFTYDINGDGVISGYLTRDQVNYQRGLMANIGAVEYKGEKIETDDAPVVMANGEWENGEWTKVVHDGHIVIERDGQRFNILGQEVCK